MSQRNLSISHRECIGGGGGGGGAKVAPPNTFSMGNGQISLVRNSGKQQANALKLEISSKHLVQYILGENQGNPAMPIN